MTQRTIVLLLALMLSVCFSLATWLQPRSLVWRGERAQADTLMKALLGDGRRMFANHFYVKADVYLHGGYYPSIFDQAKLQCEDHLKGHDHDEHAGEAEDAHAEGGHDEHEHEQDVLGKPKDWLDRFGRKFRITEHTHLSANGTEREILPWLRLSAELDPQQIETYTVAAYWLRAKLGKVTEAESFLRDGLCANPDSHEILFELGRLFYENRKDPFRTRNVWEMALRKWQKNADGKVEPDKLMLEQILTNLARLEEHERNMAKAIGYLRQLKLLSPHPELIEQQIVSLQQALRKNTNSPAAGPN